MLHENTISLSGYITEPKDIPKVTRGLTVISLSQTTQNNTEWEKTHFYDLEFFNMGKRRLADWSFEQLRKGDEIFVKGELRTTVREINGVKVKFTKLEVSDFKLLSTKETRALLSDVRKQRSEPKAAPDPQPAQNGSWDDSGAAAEAPQKTALVAPKPQSFGSWGDPGPTPNLAPAQAG